MIHAPSLTSDWYMVDSQRYSKNTKKILQNDAECHPILFNLDYTTQIRSNANRSTYGVPEVPFSPVCLENEK